MALLDLTGYQFNNYIRPVEATVKTITAVYNGEKGVFDEVGGDEPQSRIKVGDILAIGAIPQNVLVTDIRAIYEEGFDIDTEFDFGFLGDYPSDNITKFATNVLADDTIEHGNQYIPLGTTGVRAPDGTSITTVESDYRGAIWNGNTRPMMLAIEVKNDAVGAGNALSVGKVKILVSYIRYGNEDIYRGEPIKWNK